MAELKDSGNRQVFDSGAQRDMAEGKGRCDLLPLSVIGNCLGSECLKELEKFQNTGNINYLYVAVDKCVDEMFDSDNPEIIPFLELAKHFEDGARKYTDNNWKKGMPCKIYIDSAVRHYIKWAYDRVDEPHDRACLWNIICCIWTAENLPDMKWYPHTD